MSNQIHMKIGAPVMMVSNLNQTHGICNGTRMMVTRLGNRILEAEMMTGIEAGPCLNRGQ